MLANPIIGRLYSDPFVWGVALIAMWVEVRTVVWLLRKWGSDARGLDATLFAVNLTTWLPFLVLVDGVERWPLPTWLAIAGLEGLVVAVEAVLLHAATRGRVFSRGLPCAPLSWPRAWCASLLGNVMSVAVSVAAPLGIYLLALAWRG